MALSVMLVLVWVFTIQIYLPWHFLLCLCWPGCSQYRFIYLDTFCYACVGLGVYNTDLFIMALYVRLVLVCVFTIDLFIMALSVMLVLAWVFTIQIYLSWHFLLGLCWSGCSQYRFIYLGTFCYACGGLGVHNIFIYL